MKILLVIPRYKNTTSINYNYYFPLGLAYIASILKHAGYNVTCLNLNHYHGKTDKLLSAELDRYDYDVICTGHICTGYSILKEIVETAHKHPSRPVTILGGTLVTSESELTIRNLVVDYGVVGEGEDTILELLEYIKNGNNPAGVKGICYLDKDYQYVQTEKRPIIKDLDRIPFPDFEGTGFAKKIDNNFVNDTNWTVFDHPRIYSVITNRGCPYQCTFCFHLLGNKTRERSIDNVISELSQNIRHYQINTILIHDNMFSLNKNRLLEFCNRMLTLRNQIPWEFYWSCNLAVTNIDAETLENMKDAGCNSIIYGFESMSEKVLKSMRKPITPTEIDRVFKLSLKNNFYITGNFILGDRAETTATAAETLDYWKKHSNEQIEIDFIRPFPNSVIYQHCIEKGIIKDKWAYITKEMEDIPIFNMTDGMSNEEFERLKKQIVLINLKRRIYVSPTSKEKIRKNVYKIRIRCPYCNNYAIYDNFYIESIIGYHSRLNCKHCNYHFILVSIIRKVYYRYFIGFRPLIRTLKNVITIKNCQNTLKKLFID